MTTLSHLTFQDVETHVIITSFCDINNVSSNRCEIVTTLSHPTFQDVATHVIITSFSHINKISSNRCEILTTLSHLTFQDVATHVIITSFCDINNMSSNRCEILTTLSHLTFQDVATDVTITSFGDVISLTEIRRNFVMTIRLKIVYVTNRRNYHVDFWLITSWQDFNLHVTWFSRHVPAGRSNRTCSDFCVHPPRVHLPICHFFLVVFRFVWQPIKDETLNHCWFNAGLSSAMLAEHEFYSKLALCNVSYLPGCCDTER